MSEIETGVLYKEEVLYDYPDIFTKFKWENGRAICSYFKEIRHKDAPFAINDCGNFMKIPIKLIHKK
jgi:hypothetical protein